MKVSTAVNVATKMAAAAKKAFVVLNYKGTAIVADSFDLMSKFAAASDDDVLAVVKPDGEVVYA